MSMLRSLALLSILAIGLLSCAGGAPTEPLASGAATRPLKLEFAEVLADDAPSGKEFPVSNPLPQGKAQVRLSEPVAFDVARAWEEKDYDGHPAVGFELTASEKPRFRAWTAEHLNRNIAIVVDARVRMIATVRSALPGVGTIERGERGFPAEEVREIVAGLQAGAK